MTLKEYQKSKGWTLEQLGEELGKELGTVFSRQHIHSYVYRHTVPTLEIAMIIFRATKGAVQLHEMLNDDTRNRTKTGAKIFTVTGYVCED